MWRHGLFAMLLLTSACGRRNFNVDAADEVDASPDSRANFVFATSSLHNANLGGLAAADAICQQRATDAGLPGTYVAYLSSGGVHASTRLVGSRGWQRVDGKPVADTTAQLASLRMWYPISTDELGNDLRGLPIRVWTGAAVDGSVGGTCNDWSDAANNSLSAVGLLESGGGRWTYADLATCDTQARLYCFEIGQRTVMAPPRVTGRLAFVSNGVWAPAGIASADALCNGEGQAVKPTATFKAALPLSTATTASRFTVTGATWVRSDGVPIVDTPASMFTAAVSRAHVILAADGQLTGQTTYWSGYPDLLAQLAESCSDWTVPSNGMAIAGYGDGTTRGQRFVGVGRPCNQAASLLCLEE
jgi:hypothetical protein